MRMQASVYAVIANGTERLADFDTRAEAEDRAAAEAEYGQEGESFEVRLLDRKRWDRDAEERREAYLKWLFR